MKTLIFAFFGTAAELQPAINRRNTLIKGARHFAENYENVLKVLFDL